MPEERWQLLAELRNKKHSCSTALVETALAASGFSKGRSKGHVQVWSFEHLTLTLHRPHGKHLDPRAVAMVIKLIEEANTQQHRRAAPAPQDIPGSD